MDRIVFTKLEADVLLDARNRFQREKAVRTACGVRPGASAEAIAAAEKKYLPSSVEKCAGFKSIGPKRPNNNLLSRRLACCRRRR